MHLPGRYLSEDAGGAAALCSAAVVRSTLAAVTSRNCNDSEFCLELLELLGDAVLKLLASNAKFVDRWVGFTPSVHDATWSSRSVPRQVAGTSRDE